MADINEAIRKISQILEQLTQNQSPKVDECRGMQLLPFDEGNETFDSYLQRLQNYLEMRNLNDNTEEKDKKCVQILINCLGPKLYHTLTCLTAPDTPKDKTFKELTELLKTHICPKHSEVAEQHKFTLRVQHEGESVANFQADLKRLGSSCNFICDHCKKSTINAHLRSQFIRGIRDNDIRERLLQQDSSKTFNDTVKLALAIEAAKMESKEIRSHTSASVHAINKANVNKPTNQYQTRPSNTKTNFSAANRNDGYHNRHQISTQHIRGKCFKCGKKDHKANSCKTRNLKCTKCNKEGHLHSVCLSKTFRDQKVLTVEDTSVSDTDDDFFINKVMTCNAIIKNKILREILVDNVSYTMEFDTGAAVSTVSEVTFRKLWPGKKLCPTSIKLKTYTGEIMHPLGTCSMKISYGGNKAMGDLYVLQQNVDSILGRDWMEKLKMHISPINQVGSAADISEDLCKKRINELLRNYADIFTETIGKIPETKCSFSLKDANVMPIFLKPRPVPYALRKKN